MGQGVCLSHDQAARSGTCKRVQAFSSAQTASCPRRERYNSADIFTRYRHEDASTVMSEPAMSATEHEGQFPSTTLSACYRFGQATFAATHGNGREAPKAAIAGQFRPLLVFVRRSDLAAEDG